MTQCFLYLEIIKKTSFSLIEFEDFPFGEFFHVKKFPYYYPDFIKEKASKNYDIAFIEDVFVSKLFDRSGAQIPQGLRIGFIDFEISCIR